jgi:hypothetical protein
MGGLRGGGGTLSPAPFLCCNPGQVPDGLPGLKPLPLAVDLDQRRGRDLEEPPRAVPGPDPELDHHRSVAGDDPEPCKIFFVILRELRD